MSKQIVRIQPPDKCEKFAIFILYLDELRIGHAKLTIDDSIATLADIIIFNGKLPLPYIPFIKVHRNYRNNGYGTLLLKRVIEFCRENGIQQIHGQIVGDRPKLVSWYRRHGFSITDDTTIMMDLNS